VETDETYLHNSHARGIGWFFAPKSAPSSRVNSVVVVQEPALAPVVEETPAREPTGDRVPKSKGERLILIHAITKDGGLVAPRNSDGEYDETKCRLPYNSIQMTDTTTTAEWVFKADARLTDYHKKMDGVMFMRWVKLQLIPSLKDKYPKKKITLILDNAPYHGTTPENSIAPKSMTKKACIIELQEISDRREMIEDKEEIELITTERTDSGGDKLTFGVLTWEKRASKKGTGGPYAEEVQDHLLKVAKKYEPERLKTELTIAFEAEGWDIIYTPPYEPKFQPAERGWAYGKNQVAEEWRTGRSLQETHEDLMICWYGGERVKTKKLSEGVTIDRVAGWFNASEEDMNVWIKRWGVKASGTIDAFEWDSEKAYGDGEHYEDEDEFSIEEGLDAIEGGAD
jgi:hypothetical protein